MKCNSPNDLSYINYEVIDMSPFELTMFITIIANAIAEDRTTSELNILATLFTQLGDTLATISALSPEESAQ